MSGRGARRSCSTSIRHPLASWVVVATVALAGCAPPGGDIALVGLEPTTYVNGAITFTVGVVGAPADSIELRRDGQLFHVFDGQSYVWDTLGVPEGSYTFVARMRRGGATVDSAPRVVVVDRTPPTVALTVTPSADPMILPGGTVDFVVEASDEHGVPAVEIVDGDVVVATLTAPPFAHVVPAARGLHAYRARVVDRAGNVGLSAVTVVPIYVRVAATLPSEAARDGCIGAGYEPQYFTRHFGNATCPFDSSYTYLHFFSFDLSAYPGAQVESATLQIAMQINPAPYAFLGGVQYDDTADAPPTSFVYPFVSTIPETAVMPLVSGSTWSIDVTNLAVAQAAEGRERIQLRLRPQYNSPTGVVYFAEAGGTVVPQLVTELLVP
jgi:hypothetical protein